QLERDQSNASLSSLRAVAEALGSNLVDLFSDTGPRRVVYVPRDQRLHLTDEGSAKFEFLSNGQPSPIIPCVATLEPKSATSERPARHRGYEFALVLEGTVEYHIANECYTLEKGDSILFDASVSHRCANPGDEPCTWLWVSIDSLAS